MRQYTQSIGAADLEPSACTGTVTTIQTVNGGSHSFNTSGNLILGSNSNDTVSLSVTGYNCYVGGGPTKKNGDKFTGKAAGDGDECIVATSTPSANIKNCTIVARSP